MRRAEPVVVNRSWTRSMPAGMTLIEVMTVLFITGLILTVVMAVYLGVVRTVRVSHAQAEAVRDASLVLSAVGRTAIQTLGVEASHTIVSTSTLYTTDQDTVVMKLAAVDANDAVVPSAYDYVIYTRDDSSPNIFRQIIDADPASVRVDTDRVITSLMTTVHFIYRGADPVTTDELDVILSTTKTNGTISASMTLTAHATLRNK